MKQRAILSLFFFMFVFTKQFLFNTVDSKLNCRWQDLNWGSLVSEATALPTNRCLPLSFLGTFFVKYGNSFFFFFEKISTALPTHVYLSISLDLNDRFSLSSLTGLIFQSIFRSPKKNRKKFEKLKVDNDVDDTRRRLKRPLFTSPSSS